MKASLPLSAAAGRPTAARARHAGGHLGALRLGAVVFGNELRGYLRNRVAVFWVFVFPLLLYALLGFAIGNDLGVLRVSIAAADDPASRVAAARIETGLRAARLFRTEIAPAGAAAELRLQVQADAGRLRIVTDHAPSRSAALYLALRDVEQAAQAQALALAPAAPRVEIVAAARSGESAPLRYDRFLFCGVVVLMMLSGGVLSLGYALAGQREQNVLKGLATWPLPPRLYLAGVVGARLVLLVAGALAFLLLGQCVFGLEMRLEPLRIAATMLLLLLGSALFLAIGCCLAARSASVAATELIGNAVYYPLLLLGDLTLPLRAMPQPLDSVLHWLPTQQLAAGLRAALFDPAPYAWPWPLLAYLLLALALCAALGGRAFHFTAPEQ